MLDNYDKSILIFHYYYVNINIHINNNFTCKNLHNNIISCVTSVNIKSDKNNINLLGVSDFLFTFVNAKKHPYIPSYSGNSHEDVCQPMYMRPSR